MYTLIKQVYFYCMFCLYWQLKMKCLSHSIPNRQNNDSPSPPASGSSRVLFCFFSLEESSLCIAFPAAIIYSGTLGYINRYGYRLHEEDEENGKVFNDLDIIDHGQIKIDPASPVADYYSDPIAKCTK